jgi:hypothetical protein
MALLVDPLRVDMMREDVQNCEATEYSEPQKKSTVHTTDDTSVRIWGHNGWSSTHWPAVIKY